MSSRVEAAIQSFYEDADLRGELTDDEANVLLRWAETELSKVDAASADDAAFEAATDTLSSLIKSINRFIGRRGYSTPEEQAAGFAKISAHAKALGYPLPADAFTASFDAQAAADNITALQALLSDIEHSAAPVAAQAAAAAPDTAQTDTPPATTAPEPVTAPPALPAETPAFPAVPEAHVPAAPVLSEEDSHDEAAFVVSSPPEETSDESAFLPKTWLEKLFPAGDDADEHDEHLPGEPP